MKVRLGFVSNSSSSSFCIYGVALYTEELEKFMKSKGLDIDFDDDNSNDIIQKELDKITKQLGIDYNSIYSWESQYALIGKNFESMKQNETRKEFESKVKKDFSKAKLPKPIFILENVSY